MAALACTCGAGVDRPECGTMPAIGMRAGIAAAPLDAVTTSASAEIARVFVKACPRTLVPDSCRCGRGRRLASCGVHCLDTQTHLVRGVALRQLVGGARGVPDG